jgi:hypothetical protein
MSVSYAQRQVIERNRRVYLSSRDGREALRDMLVSCGLFGTMQDWKDLLEAPEPSLRLLIEALLLLKDCGVLIQENFGPLIDKMAELPLPDIEDSENGET